MLINICFSEEIEKIYQTQSSVPPSTPPTETEFILDFLDHQNMIAL